MSLKEQILGDMKEAMRAKDQVRLDAIRQLKSAIMNREIELRPDPIKDDEVLKVIKKFTKQLKDAIEQYENAGRQELVDKEKAQLDVVETYLPQMMSKEDVEKIVEAVMAETGAASMKDMGKVIQGTMAKAKGAADGKMISEIVKARLS